MKRMIAILLLQTNVVFPINLWGALAGEPDMTATPPRHASFRACLDREVTEFLTSGARLDAFDGADITILFDRCDSNITSLDEYSDLLIKSGFSKEKVVFKSNKALGKKYDLFALRPFGPVDGEMYNIIITIYYESFNGVDIIQQKSANIFIESI